MRTIDETLTLLKRQTKLEAAMKRPGGIHITEEHELHIVRRRLAVFPEALNAVAQASHALRRPLDEMTAIDVESWAGRERETVPVDGE